MFSYKQTFALPCTHECCSLCEAHYTEKQLNHQPGPAVCGIDTCGLVTSGVKETLHRNHDGFKGRGLPKETVGSSMQNTVFLLMLLWSYNIFYLDATFKILWGVFLFFHPINYHFSKSVDSLMKPLH